MAVRALFRGPFHVVEEADEDLVRLTGLEVVGLPACEVWTDPASRLVQARMTAVYLDGIPRTVEGVPNTEGVMGSVLIAPWLERGRIVGVGTDWQPSPRSLAPAHRDEPDLEFAQPA